MTYNQTSADQFQVASEAKYEGRFIKLQYDIILLIFKIWIFGNIHFVGNLIGDMHNNNFLLSLSRLVQNRFYAIGIHGRPITTMSASVGQIKSAVWAKFTETVWKF